VYVLEFPYVDNPIGEVVAPPPADECNANALRSVPAHLRLWIVAIVGLVADLWSKEWAFDTLAPNKAHTLVPGLLDMQLSLNSGALFGMGSGLVWLFIGASLVALGFVLYLFSGSHPRQRVVHIALGLILAGALGNLHDRVYHHYDLVKVKTNNSGETVSMLGTVIEGGRDELLHIRLWWMTGGDRAFKKTSIKGDVKSVGVVRDFLRITPEAFGNPIWKWIFNVADALLVVGVSLLLLSFWFQRPPPGDSQAVSAS